MTPPGELILGYWPIRGRCGAIRNLLAYLNIPYKAKLYYDMDEWFEKDKKDLKLDFPNIPYIIDGNKKITESQAILHYIPLKAGRKDLIGSSDDKFIQVQICLHALAEVGHEMKTVWYSGKDFKKNLEKLILEGYLPNKLENFNKKLEGKEWLTGFLSIADFQLYETVEMMGEIAPELLEQFPNLVCFRKRFSEIPAIKAFRQSKGFKKIWYPLL